MATKKKTVTATVKATTARATTRGRVDSGEKEFETLLRQMFVFSVHRWAKTALDAKAIDKMPSNEERKVVVEDLVAMWSCAVETMLDSAVDTFLSTTVDEDDEVDCPKCGEVLELPEDYESGEVECPSCDHAFDPDEDDDDDDPDDGEPMVIEGEIVEDPPTRRRA